MAGMSKARLTTALVVVAAAAAVGLSVFAVNQSGVSARAAAAVPNSAVDSSRAAPVTTGSSPAPAVGSASVTLEPTTTAPTTTAPATTPPTVGPAPAAPAPRPAQSATYTVKTGDNLSAIAAWFKLNGYGDLYEANEAVIGANPNLIYPGQTITLSATGVTMGG